LKGGKRIIGIDASSWERDLGREVGPYTVDRVRRGKKKKPPAFFYTEGILMGLASIRTLLVVLSGRQCIATGDLCTTFSRDCEPKRGRRPPLPLF